MQSLSAPSKHGTLELKEKYAHPAPSPIEHIQGVEQCNGLLSHLKNENKTLIEVNE